MSAEFQEMNLDEVYEFSSGLSKPRSEFGSGYDFLSFKDVFYNYFVPEKLAELVKSTEKERASCSIKRGDVFLTRTSETMDELGMSCVALKDYPDATFNGFTKRLRPKDPDLIVPEYAAYYFRSYAFRSSVTAMSTLSTRASLNNEMLSRLKIVFPDKAQQEKIGSVLKCFDDKIKLNRQINQTLEQIAQTIFKSWFVDFEPVKAKIEAKQALTPALSQREREAIVERAAMCAISGKLEPELDQLPREQYQQLAATAALFPDELVESELGLIPKGWDIGQLVDITNYLNRGISPSYVEEGGVLVLNQKCVRDNSLDFAQARRHDFLKRKIDGRELKVGDVLINSTGVGTLGRVAQVLHLPEKAIVDSHVTVARANELISWNFLGLALQRRQSEIEQLGEGSTGQTELNRAKLSAITTIIPPMVVIQAFDSITLPIREMFVQNLLQNMTITDTRDSLLPKLLSGELCVNGVV